MKGPRLACQVLRATDQRAIDGLPGELRPDMAGRRDRHNVAICGHAAGLGRQKRRDVKVRRDPPLPAARIGFDRAHTPLLLGDFVDGVLRQGAERPRRLGERGRGQAAARPTSIVKRALSSLLRPIACREMFRGFLVVAFQRLVRLVRYASAKRFEVEHPEQCVAAADVGVEETERFARLDRFDPQRHFRQLDRHRIAIDAIETLACDVA